MLCSFLGSVGPRLLNEKFTSPTNSEICFPGIQSLQWFVLGFVVSRILNQRIHISNHRQSIHSWDAAIYNWPCRFFSGFAVVALSNSLSTMLWAFTSLPMMCCFHLSSRDREDSLVCCCFLLGFFHLVGGDGPCSGRVEVHSWEDWIPVSDGNFTLLTAQVICAELGCGKAVSVLGHELFRESDGWVWA